MESAQQQQYYSYLQRMRRQAVAHQSLNAYNILAIRQWMAAGNDPRDDEHILKEFWILVNECGSEVFSDELSHLGLTIEDGELKPID